MSTSRAWSFADSRLAALICTAGVLLVSPSGARAQAVPQPAADQVVVRDSRGREVTRAGEILAYNARRMTLKLAGGREVQLPSADIVAVVERRSAEHQEAEAAYRAGESERALLAFQDAYRQETRAWLKLRMVAQTIRCRQNLGQVGQAAQDFVRLLEVEPETLDFDAIPLSWLPRPPDARFQCDATAWLEPRNSPAARLIAASWLLTGVRRANAADVLRQLAADQDTRIAQLATFQIVRTQVHDADDPTLARWESEIDRLPISLRGGPYYLLATAHGHRRHDAAALLAWMQVGMQYPQQRELAAESLFQAARSLDRLGRADEAQIVTEELRTRFADTVAGRTQTVEMSPSAAGR